LHTMTKAHILVFNGTPQSAESRLVAAGSKPYDQLIRQSLDQHLQAGIKLDYFSLRVADGERLPSGIGISDFDGVWISGSPLSAYKLDQPSVRTQINLAREIWDAGIPTFGSCWGLQIMAAALGGSVRLNPAGREIGVARRIILTDAGQDHAMYRSKRSAFDALCTHEDDVRLLPACGKVLASNEVSAIQAAVMRDGHRSFWGVQYHPEFELATIAAVIATRAERHIDEGLARSEQDVAAIVADFRVLGSDPARKDLAWKYGVAPDVLNNTTRTLELGNWLTFEVLPLCS
jgi:GMP synthase (glutamine-hydrolysing)